VLQLAEQFVEPEAGQRRQAQRRRAPELAAGRALAVLSHALMVPTEVEQPTRARQIPECLALAQLPRSRQRLRGCIDRSISDRPRATGEFVTRRGLTSEWSIDVDESFRGRVVDEDLQLLSLGPPVRTIWIAVWSPPPTLPPAEILDGILQDVHPSPHQRFREGGADPEELRYGSWYPETDDGREQWGLYGYTVRPGSYVQAALLTDAPDDLEWALTTWRSLRFRSVRSPG
jgi:hypothetical protein